MRDREEILKEAYSGLPFREIEVFLDIREVTKTNNLGLHEVAGLLRDMLVELRSLNQPKPVEEDDYIGCTCCVKKATKE